MSDQNAPAQQKSLIAISAVSIDENTPLEIFYNQQVIERLFNIANKLEHKQNALAMDALRNLIVQAYLVDKSEYVELILSSGLLQTYENIIKEAT